MPYENISELMDDGYPVGVKFINDIQAPANQTLFCELIQRARYGESVSFSEQGCPIGAYVLGRNVSRPTDYYFSSGRYKNRSSAARAAGSLPQLSTHYTSIELFALKESSIDVDVVLLFITPAKAMRFIQALSYHNGLPVDFTTGGIASVCGDCTAVPANTGQLCISFGCKGSRKHSRYADEEVIVGIPHSLLYSIQEGLKAIPGIFD
jgi:uncharacterized protein (DUF169 family)